MPPVLHKCILESTFSSGDSALRDKSVILRGGLAHYRLDKSLRPPLENTNLSSQILESSSGSEKQAQILESTFSPPAWDSKIVELESWLCKSRKEDKTRGLSTPRDEAIRDSSPQDESPRIHFYKGSL